MIRPFAFVLFLAAAVSARAQPPLDIRADAPGETNFKTGETVFKEHVRLTDGSLLLTADELRFDNKTGVATATGHVVLTLPPTGKTALKLGPIRLLADTLVYRRTDRSFSAEKIRLGAYPYYAEGASATGTGDEIVITQATVSYGEPGPWQPTFTAGKIFYVPGQRLRAESSQAGLGSVQPLPFPKFTQDLHESLISHVSLTGGYRSSLGAFIDTGLHLPVAAGVFLGGDLGVYTARGVMIGPSGSYTNADGSSDLHGDFHTGFINDHGEKKTDVLGRPVPENRGFIAWEHRQQLTDQLSLTAQLNWWKDSEILRDFRPKEFFPVQEPDTFVESVYTGQNYLVSAFARFQPNAFDTVQERLPEIRFDLLPLPVGQGFYERFNASAAVLREDPPLGAQRLASDRLDAYYALSRPFAPTDWLAFTPVAGGRVTHYANTVGATQPGNYTRTLGELGFDATLRASATFDYQNPQWKIDGLRHLFTPRLSYRYIPEADKGSGHIPPIDRETFSTYLPPLGLGDTRNIDQLHATNTLRLGFDNTVQTRDPVYGSRDLFTFNVANDFRFTRTPGERTVSEIQTETAFAPASWIQVNAFNSFSSRTFAPHEFNSGVTLHDGAAWSVRFSNNFLQHQIEDYDVDGRRHLTETYDALMRLNYDARKRRFTEQAYGLTQNLDNTWRISYIVSLYSGPRRESHFGLNVQIEATGF